MSSSDTNARVSVTTTSDTSGLSSLQASVRDTNEWLQTLNVTMNQSVMIQGQMATSLARLTDGQKQTNDATKQTTDSHKSFLDTIKDGIVTGALYEVGMKAVSGALDLVRMGFDSIVGSAEMAIGKMQSFIEESMALSQQAQQMEYLWQYQYGGPQNGGSAIASQTAAWLPNFAMDSPYKLQDIMGAVGPLSQLGLSFQGLQRYLPLISDLSATHTSIFGGGGMLPIAYGALAVMEATKGYSRRLLMELQIRPNELEKYGLKFVGNKDSGQLANPDMFLPALEAYAKDKGYTGASKKIAHETITGLSNSLIDRWQAFSRRAMGEDIPDPSAGNLSQDVIAMIKRGDIAGAMKAVGADVPTMKSFGVDFNANGGVSDLSGFQDALQQFSQDKVYQNQVGKPEFKDNTIFSVYQKGLQDFSTWWDDHQSTFDKISKFVSDVGGQLLELARTSISNTAVGLWTGFANTFFGQGGVEAWTSMGSNFMNWLTDPRNQDLLKQAATFVGRTAGGAVAQFGAWAGPQLANAESWLSDPKNQQAIENTAKSLSDGLGNALHGIVDDLALLKKDWEEFSALFADSSGKDPAPVRFFKDLGMVLGSFFQAVGDRMKEFLTIVDDILQGLRMIGDAFNGKFDPNAAINLSRKIGADITSFMTANVINVIVSATLTGQDLKALTAGHQQSIGAPNQHVPGAGQGVSPNAAAIGYGVTQNNTYNIQGATDFAVQQIVNANNKKVTQVAATVAKTPGGLGYLRVGLF